MSQRSKLAALFALAAIPLLEIGVLIRLGQSIGFGRLALLVIATAILGTIVIRRTGVSMVTRALQGLGGGRDGLEPILDGFLQVIAGVLLIFPGVISDAIGVLLLVPPLRHKLIASGILKIFGTATFEADPVRPRSQPGSQSGPQSRHADASASADNSGGPSVDGSSSTVIIEGEYERISEKTVEPERAVRRAPRA